MPNKLPADQPQCKHCKKRKASRRHFPLCLTCFWNRTCEDCGIRTARTNRAQWCPTCVQRFTRGYFEQQSFDRARPAAADLMMHLEYYEFRAADKLPLFTHLARDFPMPIDYTKYRPDWLTVVRPRILVRAENKCEQCGRANGSRIPESGGTVVLTIAHLDHNESDWNVSDDRLKALCQRCHLAHDLKDNKKRWHTREDAAGARPLYRE